ncbi:MAG: hypothetical protein Q4D96_04570 [Propionibacteriaceae bacterium]|nr:hypothetical protein [Propionibacteriaceae bacterium]
MTIEKVLITPLPPDLEQVVTAFAAFVPEARLLGETFPVSLLSEADELWFTLHAPRRIDHEAEARLLLAEPPPRIRWWTDVALSAWHPEPGLLIMKALAEYLDGSLHDRA